MDDVEAQFIYFKHPFTCLLAGPSGSGKTFFIANLIQRVESLIEPAIRNIRYLYSQKQDFFNEIKERSPLPIDFYDDIDAIPSDPAKASLLIIDDFMSLSPKSSDIETKIAEYFIKKSHHENTSVIYICQNVFNSSKIHRTISLNAHYLILMKNPRAVNQIMFLAMQMFPKNTHFLQEVFKDATEKPWSYLLIDLKPTTPEQFRLRTDIFENKPIVYLMK